MKKFENIISLTNNLNITQRISLKKQVALVQELNNPEIEEFLTLMEAIAKNTNGYIERLSSLNDAIVSEVLAEMKEMKVGINQS